ncbi:MAG: NfeD family protein, partial [Chthoniobacteraceae bacterium]
MGGSSGQLIGRCGVAATGLYPTGQIEVEGRRYEARLEFGSAPPGTAVVVRRKTDFGFIVDREKDGS